MRHTFHDMAESAGPGLDMNVADLNTVCVQISGNSTSREIRFKASVDRDNFIDHMGLDMGTLSPSVSTTSTAKIFQFDVRCIEVLRMYLHAVAGGSVTIKGRGM